MKRDAIALTWAMVFPSLMTWVYFVAVANQGTGPNPMVMVAYFAGKIVQFSFPVIYVAMTDRQSLRPAWPKWPGVALSIVFGLVVGGAALAIYHFVLKDSRFLSATPEKVLAKLRESGYDSVAGFVGMACFISVAHSMLEEYYWRWFVFGWLKRHLRTWLAIVLASLGFMAHHVIVLAVFFPGVRQFFTLVVPFSLGIAIGGAVWCWLYDRTGSIFAPWLSHVLIDAAVMLIGYDMVADQIG